MIHPEITSLYKYRAFNEHSLQSLINEVAWFSKPSSFNDPFDCCINIDTNRIEESIRGAVKELYSKTGKDITDIPENEFKVTENDKKAFDSLKSSLHKLTQNIGILSLSSVNDDILMWGHYADSHNGFCIEYSRTPDNIMGKQSEPVNYEGNFPSLSAQEATSQSEAFKKLLLTKSTHWSYEKEWRIIEAAGDKAFQFPCDIKSIIFGLKMNEQNRFTIRRILEGRNIAFKEATKDSLKFSLCINNEMA